MATYVAEQLNVCLLTVVVVIVAAVVVVVFTYMRYCYQQQHQADCLSVRPFGCFVSLGKPSHTVSSFFAFASISNGTVRHVVGCRLMLALYRRKLYLPLPLTI